MVDVGFVGFLLVGKLMLFSVVLVVKFKIGVYYFMIIVFNLGMVCIKLGDSFVMVDFFGLIEGVS